MNKIFPLLLQSNSHSFHGNIVLLFAFSFPRFSMWGTLIKLFMSITCRVINGFWATQCPSIVGLLLFIVVFFLISDLLFLSNICLPIVLFALNSSTVSKHDSFLFILIIRVFLIILQCFSSTSYLQL